MMWMRPVFFLRSFLASLFLIVFTAIWSVIMVVGVNIFGREFGNWVISSWGDVLTKAFNIDLRVEGEENLPAEGVLFVFNHSSLFDIILICGGLKKPARFGAKIELFKIPLFSTAMKAYGILPIVRADRDRVLKLYDESIARVHRGESFILACEGTRQPTPGVGEKFKSGPFIFAINGQFPLVPLVIRGAAEILPKHELIACTRHWRTPAVIKILPPIPTKGLSLDDRQRLQEDVRLLMTKEYDGIRL